jgi:hypothetical protein
MVDNATIESNVIRRDGKWFFWDETGANDHGPFETKEQAINELNKYCEWLDSKHPLDQATLDALKRGAIAEFRGAGLDVSEFTCDGCSRRFNCGLVYDLYNTLGSCLASK